MDNSLTYSVAFAAAVAKILKEAYHKALLDNRKVATRKTYDSIEVEYSFRGASVVQKVYARESLIFVIKGRRPGGKLPVKKTANGFELVDELAEWVVAVGFTGHYYLLARKIARDGIKGIPITDLVLQNLKPQILEAAQRILVPDYMRKLKAKIRSAYL